jgi:signal transduction histidine kinase
MLLKDKELGVKITVDGKPCGNDQYFMVQGEELLCYSMLANLIKNSAEASPHAGEINISLTHSEPFAGITIHNQGTVPKEIKAKFFEKYSTAGKFGGTGLGTYSAKLMTEAQKGAISMTSDQEHGTSLIIKLPVFAYQP